jgi:hypothetical protein
MAAAPFQVGQRVMHIRYFQDPPAEEVTILNPDPNYAWKGELLDAEGNPGFILATTVVKLRPYPVIPPDASEQQKEQIIKNAMTAAELDGDTNGGVQPSYVPGALVITLRRRRQSDGAGNPWIAELMRLTSPDTTTYLKIQRPNGETEYVSRTSLQPLPVAQAPQPARARGGRRLRKRAATRKALKSRRKSRRRSIARRR